MRKIFAVLIIFCLTVPFVFADEIDGLEDEGPTVKTVWQGETPIGDAISAKAQDKISILKTETNKVMAAQEFPYVLYSGKTTVRIVKYKCDDKMQLCGYWVEAYRDGREVYTNSPIWISPPPYEVVVSESLDTKLNELTVVLKEDPKGAVERVLQRYVDMQPLGKAVSYER